MHPTAFVGELYMLQCRTSSSEGVRISEVLLSVRGGEGAKLPPWFRFFGEAPG